MTRASSAICVVQPASTGNKAFNTTRSNNHSAIHSPSRAVISPCVPDLDRILRNQLGPYPLLSLCVDLHLYRRLAQSHRVKCTCILDGVKNGRYSAVRGASLRVHRSSDRRVWLSFGDTIATVKSGHMPTSTAAALHIGLQSIGHFVHAHGSPLRPPVRDLQGILFVIPLFSFREAGVGQ
ncbi:hypothetical protein BD311DRAFT_739733 [Dichomitus squalens]|uniref:Uncharacterized protein n=1 Tax=Dichomitus squalens TaxID=114155 RepID=A0A4Q9MJS9_9APHY|nr:hypothetical protein BD311DRAFT_739733 [Dichomitus squalens]